MIIVFGKAAKTELDDGFAWYENEQKNLGYRFVDEIDATLKRISLYPA